MNTNPNSETVPDMLRERLEQTPEAIAYCRRTSENNWNSLTWFEFRKLVDSAAKTLHVMGLVKGDRLAICARTCAEWAVLDLAALTLGVVVVGVDSRGGREHVNHVLTHSGAAALIVDDVTKLRQIDPSVQQKLRFIVVINGEDELPEQPNCHRWSQLSKTPISGADTSYDGVVAPDDPATLIYTSGTTGRPKAIEFTHQQLATGCHSICQMFPEITASDSVLCWLPMDHMYQRMLNFVAIINGAQTYFVEDPHEIITCIREVQPSIFIGVPRFYEKLHEEIQNRISQLPRVRSQLVDWALRVGDAYASTIRRKQRPSLRLQLLRHVFDFVVLRKLRAVMGRNMQFMICGSAPTPLKVIEYFHSIGLLLLEGYAMSENTVTMAANRPTDFRFGSVGKPFPEHDLKFADDGELLVRGPGVFAGYLNQESQNAEFTADGFYNTGDLGHLDADGYLHLTGRKKDIIKTSTGRRISPAHVETTYGQSPYLEHVVVVGNNRRFLAALVSVCRETVERRFKANSLASPFQEGVLNSSSAIEQLVQEEIDQYGRFLAPFERIVKFAILPQSLSSSRGELTPTLKVRRDKVVQSYADLIESLYREIVAQKRA